MKRAKVGHVNSSVFAEDGDFHSRLPEQPRSRTGQQSRQGGGRREKDILPRHYDRRSPRLVRCFHTAAAAAGGAPFSSTTTPRSQRRRRGLTSLSPLQLLQQREIGGLGLGRHWNQRSQVKSLLTMKWFDVCILSPIHIEVSHLCSHLLLFTSFGSYFFFILFLPRR